MKIFEIVIARVSGKWVELSFRLQNKVSTIVKIKYDEETYCDTCNAENNYLTS